MAHSFLLYTVASAAALCYLYTRLTLYLTRRRFKRTHGCVPCPTVFNKDPILGLDVLFMMARNQKNHTTMTDTQQRYAKHGNTFHTRLLTTPVISTVEPENVKTVLSLRFRDWSFEYRKAIMGPFLGDGILNVDGAAWAHSRQLLRPNFVRGQVADLATFERLFGQLVRLIPQDGKTVELQDLFSRLTLDSSTEFLFGHSTGMLKRDGVGGDGDADADAAFGEAFDYAQVDVMTRVRLGLLDRFRWNRKGREAIRICHEYIARYVDDALEKVRLEGVSKDKMVEETKQEKTPEEQEKNRYCFLHELAKQTTDKKRIREELASLLLAGRDTTAGLLSYTFFELARRPEMWAKLRDEVEFLAGKAPTYEQLKDLKYVKWCMNESLRAHPLVPNNMRLAVRDTVLPRGGGKTGQSPLFVPKGTLVSYSTWVMQRRTDLFGEDANEYRPERWETLRPGWEYLPFNGGPRICLGQQYALTEASYVTVRMVQAFASIESRDPEPWTDCVGMTLSSKNGVKVGLTPA